MKIHKERDLPGAGIPKNWTWFDVFTGACKVEIVGTSRFPKKKACGRKRKE